MRSFAVVVLLPTLAAGHGAVSYPAPRQGIDGSIAPWNGSVPSYPIPFMFWCGKPSHNPDGSDPRNITGSNGQACFWFSNGCDISCDECDGSTGQLIQPSWVYDGPAGQNNGWTGKGIVPDPHRKQPGGGQQGARSICKKSSERKATICDPNLRTVNTNAVCGSDEDYYYYAPWRAPGTAPVIDACGVAGGVLQGQGPGTAGADYQNTSNAKLGDRGSMLPKQPTGVEWTAGEAAEVAWTVKAYHGGGYQYRLCPAGSKLTEACFQSHPLDFVGESMLRWGGLEGKTQKFNGTFATGTDVKPPGSMWAKNPLPGGPWGYALHGATFQPVCNEPKACRDSVGKKPPQMTCQCSGEGVGDLPTLEVVDHVMIPKDLPPGDWVLGWRWDCEESTQVWASCSDVTIKA